MKERFEWLQSRCDEAGNRALPCVLLVGDSISRAYYEDVRRELAGGCATLAKAVAEAVKGVL